MLVTIGILIIILLIIVVFYQNLVSAKVKVEDAEIHVKQYLKEMYNVDEENIQEQLGNWKKDGFKIDKKGLYLLDYLAYQKGLFQKKIKGFPYSVLAELFKMKNDEN